VDLEKNIPRHEVKEFLKAYGADVYVISPQGELPMLEIMRRETKAGLVAGPPIPSTWIVDGNTVHEPASEVEAALSMADARTHWGHVPKDRLYHMVNMRTARSCAFACAFCSYPVNQGPLTLMPIELVEQELKELQAMGHVRSLVFIDDTFNVPVPRFKDLMRMMAKYDFEWYSFFRPQFADEDTVKLMKAAGCRSVFLGVESADDVVLKNMNKMTTSDKMRRGTAMLREYGIATHANFIVGFPGDTEERAAKLVDFVDDLGVDFYGILPWLYIHSTPIHQRAQEFGLQGSLERWRHDTMTSETAFQLTDDLSRAAKYSVHVPSWATQPGASQWMLLANGFTVEEARQALKTFAMYRGTDVSADVLMATPEMAELQRTLARYELPKPVNQ
jgi:p-methyltransferase